MRRVYITILFLALAQTASAAWVKQSSTTLAWLYDVTFLDSQKGFIVGSGGAFLESKDGGATWTKRKNFTGDALKQIHFADASNGWLLCERDIFNRGANASSYTLRTSDGGETWTTIDFTGGGRERVTGFFFNSKGVGIAFGENGAIFEYRPDRDSWQRQPSAIRYLLLGGAFNDERSATLVGAGGSIFFSDDVGSSWNGPSVASRPAGKLNSVYFLNRTTGWIAGAGGAVFQTLSGGKTWREQSTGVMSDLTDIHFISSAEGFAVGADGTIIHSTTAGNVWYAEKTGVKHRLESIAFNGNRGIAVGFGGTILLNEGKPPRL
jgi:photosystem II stability/assembly factor-like uncharacterized protein